jgi:protein-disulfide isomerase
MLIEFILFTRIKERAYALKEAREEARQKAKALREQHKKGERRKRLAIQIGVVAAIVVSVVLIVVALVSGNNHSEKTQATPTNMSFDGGIKIGTDLKAFTSTTTPTPADGKAVPNIKIFVDYQCPVCQAFEVPNSSQIESWVKTGAATVEIHPISFLDGRGSPNEYSSRAANATACVASYSPNNYFAFSKALFINQPLEGNRGPSNNQLFNTAKQVGITNESEVESCIKEKSFGKWILKTTDATFEAGVPEFSPTFWAEKNGTPAVFVNGQHYKGGIDNAAQFAQFVMQIAAGN